MKCYTSLWKKISQVEKTHKQGAGGKECDKRYRTRKQKWEGLIEKKVSSKV